MSETITLSGPPLNASNSDPGYTPPAAPPLNASNSPVDQTQGVGGEISPAEQAAIVDARRGVETVALTPEPAEKPAPEAKTETDEPIADNTPPAIKREITKERNRRREAEAQASSIREELARERELRERTVAALEALKPKAPDPLAEPKPSREAFDSPEAYDMALEGWAARRTEATVRQQIEAETKAAREAEAAEAARKAQETEAQTIQSKWQERVAKARETRPDFDDVIANDDVHISPTMADAILRADNGPDIGYHFGMNPEVAARIAALPPVQQVFEIGKLAATLAQPAPVRVSRAPAPITPITASREAATDANREETMEEVAARVAKREAANRRPVFGTAR